MGRQIRLQGPLLGALTGTLRNIAYSSYIPIVQEPDRIAHLRAATVIGCVTPGALELWRLWARTYAPELSERMHIVPNPVADYIKYDTAIAKQDICIDIGRWDDEEPKRPALLASTIAEALKHRGTTEFHIYGNPGRIFYQIGI
jgi:hypothetical protein